MGLFSRKKDPAKELAEAIAKRGVRVRGSIEEFTEEGPLKVVTVRFTTQDGEVRSETLRQAMTPQVATGLAPGEEVEISYDRDDPSVAMIWGSPKYTTTEQGAVVRRVDSEGGEAKLPGAEE